MLQGYVEIFLEQPVFVGKKSASQDWCENHETLAPVLEAPPHTRHRCWLVGAVLPKKMAGGSVRYNFIEPTASLIELLGVTIHMVGKIKVEIFISWSETAE